MCFHPNAFCWIDVLIQVRSMYYVKTDYVMTDTSYYIMSYVHNLNWAI